METQAVCYVGYMLKSFLVLTLPPTKGHRHLSIGSHLFSSHHEHQLTWPHLSNARCLYFSTISLHCLGHLTRDVKTQESIWSHCLSRQFQVLLLGPFDSFIVLINSWDRQWFDLTRFLIVHYLSFSNLLAVPLPAS